MGVCAIYIVPESIVITPPSSETATDGQITLSAFDPNNELSVRYSIDQVPTFSGRPRYSSGNGGTVTFENLGVGSYTIYAGNSETCIQSLTVEVTFSINYGVRHRIEFKDIAQQNEYRFDISEKNYTGSITKEICADKPIVLNWRGEGNENPFTEVIPSEVNLTMISQTDSQFIHLYTSNETKFRGNLYKYNGVSYDLIWSGFLIPMLFEEEYVVKNNYPVSFTFTDGLSDLSEEDFSDDSGQVPQGRISVLTAIRYCLNKTKLRLNIKESVSLIHEDLDDEQSILTQVYIDPRVYEAENCYYTLTNLLRVFKSRIYQDNGIWYIDYIGLKAKSEVNYREFDYDGEFVAETTVEPRVLLRREDSVSPKVFFKDRSAFFKVLQTYGTLTVDYLLELKDKFNILKFGDFNASDVIDNQLKGWSITEDEVFVNTDGTKALSYGLTQGVDTSEFFTKFTYSTALRNVVPSISQKIVLSSDYITLYDTGKESLLKFTFDAEAFATIKEAFIYLDFTLECRFTEVSGSINYKTLRPVEAVKDENGFSLLVRDVLNSYKVRLYLTGDGNFNADVSLDSETFKVFSTQYESADFRVVFDIYSNQTYDYTMAEVPDIPTLTVLDRLKNKIRVVDGNIDSLPLARIRTYSLTIGELAATDLPDKIKPSDYTEDDPLTEPVYWSLERTDSRPYVIKQFTDSRTGEAYSAQVGAGQWLNQINIDNVVVGYYPERQNPKSNNALTTILDRDIRTVYDDKILHGDLDVYGLDVNYQHIAYGWFSDSNGNLLSPRWDSLDGTVGYASIQNIIRDTIYKQIYLPRILLTGNLDIRETSFSMSNTAYEVRSGRIFLPAAISLDLFENTANVSIIEILKGEAIIDENDPDLPGEGGVDPIEPPVRIREHTEEFSNEFS